MPAGVRSARVRPVSLDIQILHLVAIRGFRQLTLGSSRFILSADGLIRAKHAGRLNPLVFQFRRTFTRPATGLSQQKTQFIGTVPVDHVKVSPWRMDCAS